MINKGGLAMIKRIFWITITAILFILLVTSCDQLTDPEPIPDETDFDNENYELVWSDEFDEANRDLNTETWNYETGYGSDGWGNDEWQNYTNDTTNVHIENGNLVISTQCPSGVPAKRDGSVTSARINTKDKFSFKFGKIQARIKTPEGNGMWPAFWMMGQNFDAVGWPACGEIDIMEQSPLLFGTNTTLSTLHWFDEDTSSHTYSGENYHFDYPLTDDFHIYELEWDAQRIVGKIDGIPFMVRAIDPVLMSEFFNDFFLILNVAVGGNLGGAPDNSTVWPQNMLVDWIRVYQQEAVEEDIETFGIYTDLTPVDAGLTVGLDAEIYVWEETLTGVPYAPFEGDNVISFVSAGLGWFGAGISSNLPLDLSGFAAGNMKFMIKIPANVTFKIGINDTQGNENYVTFPADQTVYGLERDGEWGQVVIPIADIKGNVNLQALFYEFMILEEDGAQCHFVIDDIYWDGGGVAATSTTFDAQTYNENDTNATITVVDEGAADSVVSVAVDNGTDTINIDVTLDTNGNGSATLNFGTTDDNTDTIAITEDDVITLSYTDSNADIKTDTADIIGDPTNSTSFGIYTDLTPVFEALVIGDNANIWVWDGTLSNGSIPPYEGDNVISWQSAGSGWFGAGIESTSPMDFSSFAGGSMNLMIKMPADVTFKIGINDNLGNENYVEFPANTTAFGLERNGEWGQAVIPFSTLQGNVDLTVLSYEFIILEENGANCEFAIDDIYYAEGSGSAESSVSFDAATYDVSATSATVSVVDEAAASTTVSVSVDNGADAINIDVTLDADGNGSSNLNFGTTDDATDTIAITEGDILTATYIDAASETKTDSANIISSGGTIGIYTESHNAQMLNYSQIVNSADWGANGASPDVMSTAVTPVDGTYTLGVDFTDLGGAWSGIAFDYTNNPQDISSYNTLVLNINRSMMPTLTQLGVKFEDPINTEELEVNLSNYTPEYNGQWEKYNIPLSDFSGVDLSNIEYFLIVNPMDSGSNLLFGNLYFDDVYLEQ